MRPRSRGTGFPPAATSEAARFATLRSALSKPTHPSHPGQAARAPAPGLDVYTPRIYTTQAFEWDPAKRETNLRKHGIDFVDAVRMFEGLVLEREDRRRDYGERRVTFRIISARRANRDEKAAYRHLQSPEA